MNDDKDKPIHTIRSQWQCLNKDCNKRSTFQPIPVLKVINYQTTTKWKCNICGKPCKLVKEKRRGFENE